MTCGFSNLTDVSVKFSERKASAVQNGIGYH